MHELAYKLTYFKLSTIKINENKIKIYLFCLLELLISQLKLF